MDWTERFADAVRESGVPGASLAIRTPDILFQTASGVLNVETGVEATPDSLFQVGSIAKLYTTALVMQLVDAERLDLDEPIRAVLPGFQLADDDVARRLTMRHLLTHTSGIAGDVMNDTGRGDNALELYVDALSDVGMTHPLGATFSYCNTAFHIAGRVAEVLTGQPWDRAVHERIVEPLGLTHTVVLPEDALRFRTAYGHKSGPDGAPMLVRRWAIPRFDGPAGVLNARAIDVIDFALALARGRIVSPDSAAAMQQPRVRLPVEVDYETHWGLGWALAEYSGRRVIGHNGSTSGQTAYLRIVPDAGIALCLLTNGDGKSLCRSLFPGLLAELADIHVPAPPTPVSTTLDLSRHAGLYERADLTIELRVEDDHLRGEAARLFALDGGSIPPPIGLTIVPSTSDGHLARLDTDRLWTPVGFLDVNGADYLHFGLQCIRRISR